MGVAGPVGGGGGGGGGSVGWLGLGGNAGCAGVNSWRGFQLFTSSSVLRSENFVSCRV